MQVRRDESRTNALNRVWRVHTTRNYGRGRRLDRIHLEFWPACLEHLRATCQVPAGTHACNQNIQPFRKVVQNFTRGGARVRVDIGRVIKLLWHPRAGSRRDQFPGLRDGALYAHLARRQHEACAVCKHQTPPLNRHAVGHDQHQLVALYRRHHGQPNAGVARSRLDNRRSGLQFTTLLSRLHHRKRDPVLDRASRVAALGLYPDPVRVAKQAVDADMGGVANRLEDVVDFHCIAPVTCAVFSQRWIIAPVKPTRLPLVQAARSTLTRRVETPHWRNVRTAQGGVAANGCPLKPGHGNTWHHQVGKCTA